MYVCTVNVQVCMYCTSTVCMYVYIHSFKHAFMHAYFTRTYYYSTCPPAYLPCMDACMPSSALAGNAPGMKVECVHARTHIAYRISHIAYRVKANKYRRVRIR